MKLAFCCTMCGKTSVITDPHSEDDLQVNSRSVLAGRVMGKGRAGVATYHGMMGMLPPVTQQHYSYYNESIQYASEAERETSCAAAAAHLRKDVVGDELLDIKVTCDATWQKRGRWGCGRGILGQWAGVGH